MGNKHFHIFSPIGRGSCTASEITESDQLLQSQESGAIRNVAVFCFCIEKMVVIERPKSSDCPQVFNCISLFNVRDYIQRTTYLNHCKNEAAQADPKVPRSAPEKGMDCKTFLAGQRE